MKSNPRQIAVEILNRVEKGGYAEPLIDSALTRPGLENISDRRLVTQLVYGTLRMRGRLDWHLEKLCRTRPEKMLPGLRNILRAGLFQIIFMDRIPDHAAVDQSAALAGRMFPGRVGLVNAVLRNAIRQETWDYPDPAGEPARHISVLHSHPLWLVERWIGLFGPEETLALCRANNETPPLCVRVNRLKGSRESLIYVLEREESAPVPTPYSPDGLVIRNLPGPVRGLDSFREGKFQVQDEGSQMIAYVCDARPGEVILDACSGTGGKATHLAELMQNKGSILALDIHPGKLEGLKESARRLGISIIATRRGDAAEDMSEDFRGRFDRILIDAPCSGLGTLRRNPEIKWRLRPEDLEACSLLQGRILARIAGYLKRGGILVYTTCSVMPEENEDVIGKFLSLNPGFRPAAMPASIPGELTGDSGFFRSRPDRHGMDGFFAARLEKTG